MLWYRLGIEVLEVVDWHVPLEMSSSSGDSDSEDYHNTHQRCLFGPGPIRLTDSSGTKLTWLQCHCKEVVIPLHLREPLPHRHLP
jgi:hypothetical protein